MTGDSREKRARRAQGEQLSFLEAVPFVANWPKHNTLSDKALKLLLSGKVIDHPDFLAGCGSWRLASVIFQLRTLGWPVESFVIPSPTKEKPNRSITFYGLDKTYVALVSATTAGGCE